MKNIRKISLFIVLLLIATFISPILANASTTQVSTEEELRRAVDNASNGDVIELSTDIALTQPLEITNKVLTIDGNGNTISKSAESWTPNGNNGSLITAGSTGTKLTLMNITLRNAQKYGVQSYDGAYVILDNVTLTSNWYGGVLANSGSVEIKKVTLNKNGTDSNNGIEIAKGDGVYTEGTRPELIMNGTLTSTEKENIIHIDIVDPTGGFEVRNTEDSINKIFVANGKLVLVDENNEIIFESKDLGTLNVTGEPYVENLTITVRFGYKETTVSVQPGSKLTKQEFISKIDLASIELEGYTIDEFYSDANLTEVFTFEDAFAEDTTLYTKISQSMPPVGSIDGTTGNTGNNSTNNTLDTTPKTGIDNGLAIITIIFTVSIIALAALKRKEK